MKVSSACGTHPSESKAVETANAGIVILSFRRSSAREQSFGDALVGEVDHPAIETGDARLAQQRHNLSSPIELFGPWSEDSIDGLDLRRMDRGFRREAVSHAGLRLALQPAEIAEVGVDRVDRLNAENARCE